MSAFNSFRLLLSQYQDIINLCERNVEPVFNGSKSIFCHRIVGAGVKVRGCDLLRLVNRLCVFQYYDSRSSSI